MKAAPIPTRAEPSEKVLFAHQLRAVAASLVMVIHLFGVYWLARDVVASRIFAPPLAGPNARVYDLVHIEAFNFGPIGVALFFLVSGFVIPFSLAKASRLRFLAARVLRIYPTYIACLCLTLFVTWLSAQHWGRPFTWTLETIIHNALLINGNTGIESIDLVNWSLTIEIKFYVIACLMAAWINRGRILPLLLVSLALTLLIGTISTIPQSANRIPLQFTSVYFDLIGRDFLFVPFMFIGTLFFYRYRGLISRKQLVGSALLLFALFAASWPNTVLKIQFPEVPINYFYALLMFAAAYAGRAYFRPIKPVDWLASVSYPLYAVHSLVGYACVRYLTSIGVTYYLAAAITIGFILLLAYAVHRLIERPTVKLGKRIIGKRAPARPPEVVFPTGHGSKEYL